MNSKRKTSHGAPKTAVYSSVIILMLGFSSSAVHAAATASDTASSYTSDWSTSAPNSGSGFGPWDFTVNNGNNPPYVGTYLYYTSYGSSAGTSVSSGGNAWATYANQGPNNGSIDITRAFTAGASGSSSLFNQTFSVDLAADGVGDGNGGPPNSDLQVSIGTAFTLGYPGTGSDNFLLSIDGGSAQTLPVGFSALGSGIQISLAVSGALNSPTEGYKLTISPASGGAPDFTQSGTFNSDGFNTSDFGYDDSNTTGNGYFNNLNITPETAPSVPDSSNLIFELGMLATGFVIGRRKITAV